MAFWNNIDFNCDPADSTSGCDDVNAVITFTGNSQDIDLDIGGSASGDNADIDIVGASGTDSTVVAATIDGIRPQLIEAFHATKATVYHLRYLKNIRKNATPLSVINLINKELTTIKEEDNLLLISEFNTIISQEIKNQPAPFIYERIGEKFNHFFIDEFQDTSELQWENLLPLITNTLGAEDGSTMLVGDAKQAIYRWRGGRAEQFISLYNNDTSLPFDADLSYLPTNYRSCREIIGFNNQFFKHLSTVTFSKDTYKDLYQAPAQLEFSEKAGYVNISFLEFEKGADKPLLYAAKVLKIIRTHLASGPDASLKDICVLVRKRKEGVAVANLLSQYDIDIVSSETLLVSQSPEVKYIVSLLVFMHEPSNIEAKLEVINYIISKNNIGDPHLFRLDCISLNLRSLFNTLQDIGVHFSPKTALELSLYESVEYIISSFRLTQRSNAYIQFFLDFVLEFTQKPTSSVREFLDHYNLKKESLSIVTPKGINAVQIMTVHKSKGTGCVVRAWSASHCHEYNCRYACTIFFLQMCCTFLRFKFSKERIIFNWFK